MGDCQNEELRGDFDRVVKLKFLGSQFTTDAGLLAYRELDEALGLAAISAAELTDSRQGNSKRHHPLPLLRQSVLSRLAGCEDVNDAEQLCLDPAMRHVVGGRAASSENRAASASEVGRFELESGRRNDGNGLGAEKNHGNSFRAGRGGGRVVKLVSDSSPDRFRAQARWEVSVD